MGDAYDNYEDRMDRMDRMWRALEEIDQRPCLIRYHNRSKQGRFYREGGKQADELARTALKLPPKSDFFKSEQQKEKETNMALYKYTVDGKVVYGKRLAVDGMSWVMKGVDGVITVIGAKQAEEVLPYTVAVKYLSETQGVTKTYHYIAKEGELAVGTLIWVKGTSGLAEVIGIDTKSKLATKALDGWVLAGTPLTDLPVEQD